MFCWTVHTAYQAWDPLSLCSRDSWPCTETASADVNNHLSTNVTRELKRALTKNT